MPRDETDDETDRARSLGRARLLGKRAALGLVIVVAAAFITASTAQIVRAVFGAAIAPLPVGQAGQADSPERACAVGVRGLKLALDRASDRILSASASADDAEDAVVTFRAGLLPEWQGAESVRQACAGVR